MISSILSILRFQAQIIVHLFHWRYPLMIKWQIAWIAEQSLSLCWIHSCFLGMVLCLQLAKELISLQATPMIGAILGLTLLRELSPVFTAILLTARVASSYTSELASMCVSEQFDALYLLQTHPFQLHIIPRYLACLIMLPLCTWFCFLTSLSASLFLACLAYGIPVNLFLTSLRSSLSLWDIFTSLLKAMIFGALLALISCHYALITRGGSKQIAISTTRAVVHVLVLILAFDWLLSSCFYPTSQMVIKP
jgi:phospholipid/cholesterol/gamma-HCH transport system permease protein